jgi:hypothetical protein
VVRKVSRAASTTWGACATHADADICPGGQVSARLRSFNKKTEKPGTSGTIWIDDVGVY